MFFFFQAEDGIRDVAVTGVQTCALPISSPIRRYPDLIVHRILKWALAHPLEATLSSKTQIVPSRGSEAALYSHGSLEDIASEASEAERRADAAERELMDWKTAQFMEEHLGEEYDGLI